MRVTGVQFLIRKSDFTSRGFAKHVESFYKKSEPGEVLVFPEDIGLLTAFSAQPKGSIGEVVASLFSENEDMVEALSREFGNADQRELLFASMTARFVNDFYELFSNLSFDYGVYTIACNNMADFRSFGTEHVPESPHIYNTAFVFGPKGKEIFRQRKVFLTEMEELLGLSCGKLDDVQTFTIDRIRLGIATSMDAFSPKYIARLSGAEVILQPDANPEKWASYLENGRWQPEEWMESAHYLAQRMPSVKHVVNPMMVGCIADLEFEGQSSITKKASKSDTKMAYIGNCPETGFASLLPVNGYDVTRAMPREKIRPDGLTFPERTLSVDI